ncbi:MAG: helix-turn-helix domain-containing protein [Oscillospiraceae bacterium]|nr:helix-turn-helix domain-containing protein [Oscillospiraceae bacterium]
MDQYVSAATIKMLREKKKLTQTQLAEILHVSDKTISKWETAKGLPDITLLEPLAKALHVSVVELVTGECITNHNKTSNILRSQLYVCPICGNIMHATGQAMISCCGITLPPLVPDSCDTDHVIGCEIVDETDLYVTVRNHSMSKMHFISFIAYVTTDRFEIVKLYPEGEAQARFAIRGQNGHGILYAYCNHHGLFMKRI